MYPYFVPGLPPFTPVLTPKSSARGGEPTLADVETNPAKIASGSIMAQSFVDDLPPDFQKDARISSGVDEVDIALARR